MARRTDGDGEAVNRPAPGRTTGRVCIWALTLTAAVGAASWWIGVVHRGYDYDEVLRAHEVWLVSQGLRPYHDFFEVHPPYFILLTPIVNRSPGPYDALVALRVLSSVGNIAFLAGLAAIAFTSVERGRLWALLGTAVVAFHPAVLGFLVEFRMDGWGYALAVWSLFRFRRTSGPLRHAEMGFLTGVASLLFCPKFALLPPMIALYDGLAVRAGWRGFFRIIISYAIGLGLAAGAFVFFLIAQRIEVSRAMMILVGYMMKYNNYSLSSLGHGLLREVSGSPVLTPLIAAGLAAWVVVLLRRRTPPDSYHAALAFWLVTQAVLVALPYKQYYAPWFLFGSGYLAFLGVALSDLPRRIGAAVFVVACGLSAYGAAARATTWYREDSANYERSLIQVMDRISLPGDYVVAAPPHHPIFRRDVFYLSLNTLDPNGYDADRILDSFPSLSGLVTADRYRSELESHPPALIVLRSGGEPMPYTARQNAAIESFVRERGYKRLNMGGVWFALRPDRLGRLQSK
jgi:hypothetical protein